MAGVAAMLLMAAEPSWAQQRVGGGQALDANPRQGSGGVNSPEGQVDYQQRNNVVTGNVSGGRAFRGQVDYQAPNEFQDALGSDDLFDFRAQSLQSSPGAIRQPGGGFQPGGQSVYRSFSNAPGTGTSTRQSTRISPGQVNLYDFGAVSQGDTPLSVPAESAMPDMGGGGSGGPGEPSELMLSPLLGARQAPSVLDADGPTSGPDEPAYELDLDVPTDAEEMAPDAAEQATDTAQQVMREDLSLRPQMQQSRQASEQPLLQGEGMIQRDAMDQPATSFLGRQLQAQLQANQMRQAPTLDQRIERMQASLFNQLQQRQAAPGDTAYQNVLAAMKAERRPGEDEPAQPQQEPGLEEDTFTDLDLEEPSEEQVAQAEQARREALEQTFGDDPFADEQEGADQQAEEDQQQEPGALDVGPDLDGEADGQQAEGEGDAAGRSVDAILKQLDHQAPRLESLTGERENRVNRLLKQAEQSLAQGKFFDAERMYRQLLIDAPNRPMVRAGLIHAQLGAGMIRSAALNARKLFNEHPELIAVQYGSQLLPPKERLKWLQKELQRMISQNQGKQPGMMLAYLGYQLDSRQLIRYGLASAESQAPRDPMLPVLRRIWLEGQSAEKATGGQATPPSGQ
jgi:hypothetical protein